MIWKAFITALKPGCRMRSKAIGAPTIGAAVDTSKMKALLGLGAPLAGEAPRKDDAALFAREAVAEWMQDLQDIGGNKALCDYYRVPGADGRIRQGTDRGAQRLKLEKRIVTHGATSDRLSHEV
jgi:hypothetical protein